MLNAIDQADYEAGVRDAVSGTTTPSSERYPYRLGFIERAAGSVRSNIKAGAIPDVDWAPFRATLLEEDATAYALGWNLDPRFADNSSSFWGRQGKQERLDGFPLRALKQGTFPGLFPDQSKIATGTRTSEGTGPRPGTPPDSTAGTTPPPPPPPPPPPVPGSARPPYVTPYLCLELYVTIGGKRAYYDEVINRDRLLAGVPLLQALLDVVSPPAFRWLGDQPGESSQGFELSGPTGPIAWAVSDWIAQGYLGSPVVMGLPAWVGTKTRGRGFQFQMLGRAELEALGPDVYGSLVRVVRQADPRAWDRYRGPVILGDGSVALPQITPDGRIVAPYYRRDRF